MESVGTTDMRRTPRTSPAAAVRVALGASCMAALLLLTAGTAEGATAYTAYLGNWNPGTLVPINTASGLAGPAIAVNDPPDLAISPDGRTAWVTNNSQGTVTPVNLLTGAAGAAINVGTTPYGIAITPNDGEALVADYGSEQVTPVNLLTDTAGAPIKVGKNPYAIAITPDGRTGYVANAGSESVTPINIAQNTAGAAIPVGKEPYAIAVTPNGATAWVANLRSNSITPIEVASDTTGHSIEVKDPNSLAITPDGTAAYVTDYLQESVTPVNLITRAAGTAIAVGKEPYAVAITPDGKTAYVVNAGETTVTPIAIASNTPAAPISTGTHADSIAISPDEAPEASFQVSAQSAGSPSLFNASASSVAHGTIATYAWNFGDGSSATTSVPTVAHTYASAGDYTATLTETDSAGTSTTQVFTGQTVSRNGGPGAQTTRAVQVSEAPRASSSAPPAAAPATPARVSLHAGSVTVNRRGYAVIALHCPASAIHGCAGRITITVRVSAPSGGRARAARCARGCRPLGSVNYEARAGQTVRIRVHIAAYGMKLLKGHSSVPVILTATSVAGAQTTSVSRAILLKPPARTG